MLIMMLVSLAQAQPPPADLASLLAEALSANPAIAAAASASAAAEAAPSQMEAPADPLAGISYTNETLDELTLGESEDSVLALSWSQEVPFPGKLRLAGEAARREVDMARRREEAIRLEVAARVKQAFAQLYRIDRTMSILTESRQLLDSFQETARTRYEIGEGLLQNVLKARTEVTRLDAELEKLAQERRTVVAQLNRLAGRADSTPIGAAEALPVAAVEPLDQAALERDAVERSPEMLEAESAVRRDEARLELARRQLKPDLMWGAAYMHRGDLDPMVMGMFGLRLPVYRQRKQVQGIVQAGHLLDAARLTADSVRHRVLAEVRDLTARAGRAGTLARLYGEGVVPQARGSLESAAAAYGVGRVDFLTLLDDFNTLLSYEVEHVTQRAERVSVLAELERITARELVVPAGADPRGEEVRHE